MKKAIREKFLLSRRSVTKQRRKQIEQDLVKRLVKMSEGYKNIMSYFPLSDEVDISSFNKVLEKENRLLLPKIVGESLVAYAVTSMEKQLKTFSHTFFEPLDSCREVKDIDLVLIPGIAFDEEGGRVGFGKGHYDKFLAKKKIPSIGVCFKEQLYNGILPLEPHDIKMERLCVF